MMVASALGVIASGSVAADDTLALLPVKSIWTGTLTQCGAMHLPHRVCPSCGFYNGKLEVPRVEKKKEGAEQK